MKQATEALLREHLKQYPEMQLQDGIKLLYQNEFGGGHLIPDPAVSLRRLQAECAGLTGSSRDVRVEPIGNGRCRLYLEGLAQSGVPLERVNRMFVASAGERSGSVERFEEKCEILRDMCRQDELPWAISEVEAYLSEYKVKGYPPVSHSEQYRQNYAPAYRVMEEKYCRYWKIFAAIEEKLAQKERVTIALEGNSGAGKSTLAGILQALYDCNVFHMDDFFLPIAEKTPERLAQPGGNVAYERFFDEVLIPLQRGEAFSYRPFECWRQALGEEISVTPKPITLVEGVYSAHPQFQDPYDLKIFLQVAPEEQRRRIRQRNGEEMLERFVKEWIPLENEYFSAFHISEHCDIIFEA